MTEHVVAAGNRRGRRSREELLDRAEHLFAQYGYAGTSLSALERATGLPKSALYHHFGSKSGLLAAVMERGLNRFFEAMRTAHASDPDGDSPYERMLWYLTRTTEVLAQHQDFLRLHLLLVLSAEATDVAHTIDTVRRDGRHHMNVMIRGAFADRGPEMAQHIADRLDHFAIAGIDGGFIARHADPHEEASRQDQVLARAIAAMGDDLARNYSA